MDSISPPRQLGYTESQNWESVLLVETHGNVKTWLKKEVFGITPLYSFSFSTLRNSANSIGYIKKKISESC